MPHKDLEARRKYMREYMRANPTKPSKRRRYMRQWSKSLEGSAYIFFWRIQKEYGLSMDQFNSLFEKQGELCAICKEVISPLGRNTHIDHDHQTGKVRGLLCQHCNNGIGHFRDNPEKLQNAVQYLLKS